MTCVQLVDRMGLSACYPCRGLHAGETSSSCVLKLTEQLHVEVHWQLPFDSTTLQQQAHKPMPRRATPPPVRAPHLCVAADEGEQLNVVFTHIDPREHCRKFQFAVEVQQDSSYAGGRLMDA